MEPGCQRSVVPDSWWLTQREILCTSVRNGTEAGTLMMPSMAITGRNTSNKENWE